MHYLVLGSLNDVAEAPISVPPHFSSEVKDGVVVNVACVELFKQRKPNNIQSSGTILIDFITGLEPSQVVCLSLIPPGRTVDSYSVDSSWSPSPSSQGTELGNQGAHPISFEEQQGEGTFQRWGRAGGTRSPLWSNIA